MAAAEFSVVVAQEELALAVGEGSLVTAAAAPGQRFWVAVVARPWRQGRQFFYSAWLLQLPPDSSFSSLSRNGVSDVCSLPRQSLPLLMSSSLVPPIDSRLPEDPECSQAVCTFHIPFSRGLQQSFEDWQQ
jgi:hypothetical protein